MKNLFFSQNQISFCLLDVIISRNFSIFLFFSLSLSLENSKKCHHASFRGWYSFIQSHIAVRKKKIERKMILYFMIDHNALISRLFRYWIRWFVEILECLQKPFTFSIILLRRCDFTINQNLYYLIEFLYN